MADYSLLHCLACSSGASSITELQCQVNLPSVWSSPRLFLINELWALPVWAQPGLNSSVWLKRSTGQAQRFQQCAWRKVSQQVRDTKCTRCHRYFVSCRLEKTQCRSLCCCSLYHWFKEGNLCPAKFICKNLKVGSMEQEEALGSLCPLFRAELLDIQSCHQYNVVFLLPISPLVVLIWYYFTLFLSKAILLTDRTCC